VIHEDLRLVLEAAEGARVDDAVAITLEGHAERMLRVGMLASTRIPAPHGVRSEARRLALLEL
jgi:hypothetical protein